MLDKIYLSRRNLITLLNKLDRKAKGEVSTCTIIKTDNRHTKFPQTMVACAVTAIEDEEYYVDREPGVVHPKDTPC